MVPRGAVEQVGDSGVNVGNDPGGSSAGGTAEDGIYSGVQEES